MEDFSPIARLNRIISEASKCSSGSTTKSVWAKVIGHDVNDEIEVYESSIEFYNLVKYAEDTLGVLVRDQATRDLYEKEFVKVKSLAFTFTSGNSWNSYQRNTTGSVSFALNMGKAQYDSLVDQKEKRVGDEYLLKLKETAEELFDSIMNSDLPRDLRLKLCGDAIRIKKAIARYELHGLDGVEEAVSTLGGRVGLHSTELDKKKFSDFHSKLNATLKAYVEFAKAANITTTLIENVGKFAKSIGIDVGE